jgi:type VI secretion system protein ImpA
MSEYSAGEIKVQAWLEPLADEAAPCGPDLEYDNDFLALTQAAAGKPESQFGDAEPPNWRAVAELSEAMFGRTRDLRVAVLWSRAGLHVHGLGALALGLGLINGLVERHWDQVHPLPDPDDGDPYARVNTLTVLGETEGLIGDLRSIAIVNERSVGQVHGRAFELAWGLAPAGADEPVLGREQIGQMVAAALAINPDLRAHVLQVIEQADRLGGLLSDKLGRDVAPDLRPLKTFLGALKAALPEVSSDSPADDEAGAEAPAGEAGRPDAAARKGLSGSVSSRDDAVRAIDMVCAYLERAEPANPAPLFLRRARQLLNHNFLQLMKELAPDALAGVAGLVGVDPENVQTPDSP